MPFREELWNSELFATAGELAGLRRGEGEGQAEFSALHPVWRSGQRGRRHKCGLISNRMGILTSSLYLMRDIDDVAIKKKVINHDLQLASIM